MTGRRFLSSVEALELQERPRTATRPAAALLATPALFRHANRILPALAGAQKGMLPVSALATEVQARLGRDFNLAEFLDAIAHLQAAGALGSDGRIDAITDRGRAMAA